MSTNFGRDGDRYRRAAHRILDRVRNGTSRASDACIEWALSHLGDLGREVSAPSGVPWIVRQVEREEETA